MKKSILSVSVAAVLLVSGGALAQIRPQLPAPGEAPAGSPVAVHGVLTVGKDGTKGVIKDKSGTAVVLRGMSFDWSDNAAFGAYYNANVVGWLTHDWRVSVLRAAMTVHSGDNDGDKCNGDPGYTDSDVGAAANSTRVKSVVEAAIERGIYVIIDWHMHKLTPSCGPNKDKNLTSNASAFFGEMARLYGAYPNVIYEVWNEPIDEQWSTINTYANTVISSIRSNGGNGVVVVGSPQWSSQPNGGGSVTDSRNNVAYTIHFYANQNNHASDQAYGTNVTNAIAGGLAVFATEWGTTNADGDQGHNESKSNSWITKMESDKVGWVNWRISHENQGSAALTSSGSSGGPWNSSILSTSGGYVRGKISSANNAAYTNWSKTYPINVTVEGNGTVEKKVGNTVKPGPYDFGEEVTLTAKPADGYQFDHWEGDATGGNATPNSYKISGRGLNIKAVFVAGSMIKNGFFTTNTTDWQGSGITVTPEDGALKATVNGATAYVRQTGLNLEKNKKYALSFKVKSGSGSASVTPRVTNSSGTAYWEGDAVALTTAWKTVEAEVCMGADDANAQIRFQSNNASGAVWYLDDVVMDADGACQSTAVLPMTVRTQKAAWSVSRAGGALTLRGPNEAGAVASLYDTRGRVIRSVAAVNGLTLGAGVPAGSYFLVVKNRAGGEVYRTRVLLAR
jgi:endoglucanase